MGRSGFACIGRGVHRRGRLTAGNPRIIHVAVLLLLVCHPLGQLIQALLTFCCCRLRKVVANGFTQFFHNHFTFHCWGQWLALPIRHARTVLDSNMGALCGSQSCTQVRQVETDAVVLEGRPGTRRCVCFCWFPFSRLHSQRHP